MDEELLDKMAEAGTRFMSYAVETASPRLQKLIRKNNKLDRVFQAIEYSTKLGIITRGFFMLGFPTETEEEALETARFARDSSLTGATFFTVVYFPGTELFQLAREMGYFSGDGYDVRRDYVEVGEGPYEFSVGRLRQIKQKAVADFAFSRFRIENALRLLPRYYTTREIDGFFMSYVVSSGMRECDVVDPWVRERLHRHFVIASRFSNPEGLYV